ncbi:uncharacterized protein K444DRAFT_633625 [Hyaloscypha bicolor E]|uniref:Uncharacterized protein n=1 Tax=Hyaloscypha bicolor E TaxID=1095630 RepID=A0A2J6SXL4_9HELO|nr:uncharacterized protein K444DRAFT_633625 [Hyaloscypha bicolor E]PMD55491.1 hypothetical protein K444DRAFT_633625 [Hyaloscypha bicolor E]
MAALSETIRTVENRLVRLVNEAIKYKFGVNGKDRRIRPADLVIDPSVSIQTYYFRDKAVYNKGPWKDFVNYNTSGKLPPNTIVQKLFLDIDKAVIDGDIIVKLVDTPGQAIDWDNLREWHYYSPGIKFNNEFDHSLSWESGNKDVRMGYYVYINYSKGNDCEGNENGEDNKDNKSD